MYLNLNNEISPLKNCQDKPLISALLQYKKINIFEYLNSIDFDEIAIEFCDVQSLKALEKEYQKLIKKNPLSEEVKQIKNYLEENTYKGQPKKVFQQQKYIKKSIIKILNRELKQLDPDLANRLKKSIYFSQN